VLADVVLVNVHIQSLVDLPLHIIILLFLLIYYIHFFYMWDRNMYNQ
jgi:hypothetical protein